MSIEEIQDLLSDAIQTDWEHGVAWMNDQAAAEFKKLYPTIWGFMQTIMVYLLIDLEFQEQVLEVILHLC